MKRKNDIIPMRHNRRTNSGKIIDYQMVKLLDVAPVVQDLSLPPSALSKKSYSDFKRWLKQAR